MSIYRQAPHYRPKPSPWQRIAKVFLILLLLAGLISAIFLLFFRGFVVDTPAGPRLQLPILSKTQPSDEGSADAVFSNDPTVTLSDESAAAPLSPLHAILLSSDAILDGTVKEQMQKGGGNAVIFDMRMEDGSLGYVSKLRQAIDSGASAATPGLNDAIRTMNQNPALYSIARVSCFSDEKLTRLEPDLALKRGSGVAWRDESQRAWLSPDRDTVQTYLLDICRELRALGFDEILLTNCAYPTNGALAQRYAGSDSVETLALTLEGFYHEVRRVLAEEGMTLSVFWQPSPMNEQNQPCSGQRLEDLLPLSDRVWLEEDGPSTQEVFSSRGLSSAKLSVISVLNQPGGASSSWAIF